MCVHTTNFCEKQLPFKEKLWQFVYLICISKIYDNSAKKRMKWEDSSTVHEVTQ